MYNSLYDRLHYGGKPQDTLQKSLEGLRSRNTEERSSSARKIRRYLEQEARGRSQESFSRVLSLIIDRIEKWANSSSANDSLACTICVAEIINIPHDQIVKKTVQFVNQLSIIIAQQASGRLPAESNSSVKTLETASHVLGKLASGPTTVTSVFVEFEIKRALAWLNEKNPAEMKRYAAVLMLKELAVNSPTLFNIHSDDFFRCIFTSLCDHKPRVRTAAAVALRHALRVIGQRESRQKNRLYNDIYSQARDEFPPVGHQAGRPGRGSPLARRLSKTRSLLAGAASPRRAAASMVPFVGGGGSSAGGSEDGAQKFAYKGSNFLHGSLLGLYELIGECTGEFIQYRFEEIFETCIWRSEIRFHGDALIREAVMMILPRLTLHCPDIATFTHFYKESLDHLMLAASIQAYGGSFAAATQMQASPPPSSPSPSPPSSPTTMGNAPPRIRTDLPEPRAKGASAPLAQNAASRQVRMTTRNAAFAALGQMGALDNRSTETFQAYLPDILELIKDGLTPNPKWPFCIEALNCLRMVMQTHHVLEAVGGTAPLVEMIPFMFNGGLSESLVSTLGVLSKCLNGDVKQIQMRLLQELTHILSISAVRGGKKNRAFHHLEQEKQFKQTVRQMTQGEKSTSGFERVWSRRGSRQGPGELSPTRNSRAESTVNNNKAPDSNSSVREVWRDLKSKATHWLSGSHAPPTTAATAASAAKQDKDAYDESDPDTAMQVLALRTLATFDFRDVNLLPLVCAVVLRHLDGPEARVRLEAARACCQVVHRFLTASRHQQRDGAQESVQHVLERLVVLIMTDEDVTLRRVVIEELSTRFATPLLRNPETVRSFLVLANDQNFYIRAMAVEALGKFARLSPSSLMPSITNVLMRLLNELNFAVDSKQREESVVLLGVLVRSIGPSLARPHISPIIDTLLPKIHFVHKGVATAMLATLGEVARVGDEATLSPLLGKVLPIIVDILDDRSSSTVIKRRVALDTLATLASNAALPVWPYFCFHKLLDHILRIMVQPGSWSLRRQAMTTFGVLGALDPWLYRSQQHLVASEGQGLLDIDGGGPDQSEALLDFSSDRDLRNAVLRAYNGWDSDEDNDSAFSSDDGDVEEDPNSFLAGSFDQSSSMDSSARAGSGLVSGSKLQAELSAQVPPRTRVPTEDAIAAFAVRREGDPKRSQRPSALWGSGPRRTSYMVKSDLAEEDKAAAKQALKASAEEGGMVSPIKPHLRDPFQPAPTEGDEAGAGDGGHGEGQEDPPASPSVTPPPPPPGPPPVVAPAAEAGKDGSAVVAGPADEGAAEGRRPASRSMSGGQFAAATTSLALPSIRINNVAHKRANTAAPAFNKVRSKREALRRSSAKMYTRKQIRRKSSIRDVAQHINHLSQSSRNQRRPSNLYHVPPSPRMAGAGRSAASFGGGGGGFEGGAERERAGSLIDAGRERKGATVGHGAPVAQGQHTTANGRRAATQRLRVVVRGSFGPGQTFVGAAAVAAGAANTQVRLQQDLEPLEIDLYLSSSASSILPSSVKKSSEYYPRVAISALARVLADASMEAHQKTAVDAINKIFRSLGKDRSLFLPIVMPRLIHVIQSAGGHGKLTREAKAAQLVELGKLVDIVKKDIYPYVPAIFELVHEIWETTPKLETLELVNVIVRTLPSEMLRPHVAKLLEDLMGLLHSERDTYKFMDSHHVLAVLGHLGAALDEYLYLVVPTVMTLVDSTLIPAAVRALAIQTMTNIIHTCRVSEYATLIMHPLLHAIDDCRFSRISQPQSAPGAGATESRGGAGSKMRQRLAGVPRPGSGGTGGGSNTAGSNSASGTGVGGRGLWIADELQLLKIIVGALTALVYRLEEEYAVFVPMVELPLRETSAILLHAGPNSSGDDHAGPEEEQHEVNLYFALCQRVLKGQALSKPPWLLDAVENESVYLHDLSGLRPEAAASSMPQHQSMDVTMLKATWHTAQISTELEWHEWMRRLSLQLIRQSPKSAVQSCFPLAQVCQPLAQELFNAAFLSCWDSLENNARDNLVSQLELALVANKIPKDLLQTLLNLAEFMEHDGKPLPIDIHILSDVALKCQANAKALRYKELEFRTVPEDCIEKLITINNNLEQREAAAGAVLYARTHFAQSKEVQPQWYERLQAWEEALQAYEIKAEQLDMDLGAQQDREARQRLSMQRLHVNVGRLRCLNRVGGWHTVLSLLDEMWSELVSHDLEIGKRYIRRHRDTRSDDSQLLPRFKDSSVDMVGLPFEEGLAAQQRRQSADEMSDSQNTAAQPVGVLMRNRSHASSLTSYPTEDDDLSGLGVPSMLSRRMESTEIRIVKEERSEGVARPGTPREDDMRGSNNGTDAHGSRDARELVNLFGGERASDGRDGRISSRLSLSRNQSAQPTNIIDAASIELKDYFGGLGGVNGTVVLKTEADAGTSEMRRRRRQSTDQSRKDPYSEERELEPHEEEEEEETNLREYAQQLATLGGHAAFALGKWEDVSRFAAFVNEDRTDGNLIKIILALHDNQLEVAQRQIEHSYTILDKELSSLVVESYSRAYPRLVEVQHLVELQEILDYKRLELGDSSEEARLFLNRLRRVWSSRLQGVQNTVSVLALTLSYRSLIVDPLDDLDTWLNFAKVARKENLHNLSLQALVRLGIGGEAQQQSTSFMPFSDDTPSITSLHQVNQANNSHFRHFDPEDVSVRRRQQPSLHSLDSAMLQRKCKVKPRVALAYIKYIWAVGDRQEAIHRLQRLRAVLVRTLGLIERGELGPTVDPGGWLPGGQSGEHGWSGDSGSLYHQNTRLGPARSAGNSSACDEEHDLFEVGSAGAGPPLDMGELEKLRRDVETQEAPSSAAAEASAPGYGDEACFQHADPERDEDLDEFYLVDLQALDVDPRRVRQLKRLAVQCNCKLGSWMLEVHDGDKVLSPRGNTSLWGVDSSRNGGLGLQRASGQGGVAPGVATAAPAAAPGASEPARPPKGATRMSITGVIDKRLRTIGAAPANATSDAQDEGGPIRRPRVFRRILQHYAEATRLEPASYKAWHQWALANVRASEESANVHEAGGEEASWRALHPCVVPAVRGFFRSIALGRRGGKDVLQDILRLLSLWFSHFEDERVEQAMKDGFGTLEIESWLGVIPQLIARLKREGDLVSDLLMKIGTAHPQKLIYPLTVASKSDNEARSNAAKYVMRHMRNSFPELVDEALVVSRELIRVAVLWHEKWYNRLEEASRHYFSQSRNVEQMVSILKPLHQEMEEGAETVHEVACVQKYGLNLQEAAEWLYKFINSEPKNHTFLDQAWGLYYNVFRQIKRQLARGKHLELRNVSHLLESNNMQLAVPGTYQAGSPVIRIVGFDSAVRIIPSKQRPRVLTMQGSDGFAHTFLLKGNEDIRMDERVMQLFGLVKGLLQQDTDTSKLGLEIQRYAVVPLSSSSGIVEWVPNCDTLNALIKDYREARNIPVQIESKLMCDLAPDYDRCTIPQKVEALEHALEQTSGRDLAKVLWLKSPNSEVWIDRRTAYTRSLAAMSMVGYVLGLGDRHPSNLMLERSSGRVLHIDFGDCFEVTMNREAFPEKVPFRLTRMLIKAMEASGIDGNFRHTCRAVMRVLRDNHESILTMLEAFVYDPLVSWRILQPNEGRGDSSSASSAAAGPHSLGGSSLDVSRRMQSANTSVPSGGDASLPNEKLNKRAVDVICRVRAKLNGKDFVNVVDPDQPLPVKEQVSKLIKQATSHENIAQHYRGWSPAW